MKPIFVDTSALIALGSKHDNFHLQAMNVREELKRSQTHFVTTNAVILEFGNAFSSVTRKKAAITIIETIRQSKKWKCIDTDAILIEQGFQLFKQMSDKEWGLVDCTSIIVAKKFGIHDIFTSDHHFEQAGFSILLKLQN